MVSKLTNVLGLAALAAALAVVVVPAMDAAQAGVTRETSVVSPSDLGRDLTVASPKVVLMTASDPIAASSPQPRAVQPTTGPARVRIPVGCDRLVSVLARSAASEQLGRCLT